jgi:hypothetical protein
LEPGFIRFGYNQDILQSLETASSAAFTNNALAVESVSFWGQLDQLFFLVQPNG